MSAPLRFSALAIICVVASAGSSFAFTTSPRNVTAVPSYPSSPPPPQLTGPVTGPAHGLQKTPDCTGTTALTIVGGSYVNACSGAFARPVIH